MAGEEQSGGTPLRAVRDRNAFAAFGRAVSYLMNKENFRNQKFGQWSKILAGQINRGHYFLVVDPAGKMVGYAGWAYVDEAAARGWLNGGGDLPSTNCTDGDCIVVNAWAADDERINRFVLREVRKACIGKKTAFFKRVYEDGRVRPIELPFSEALDNHVTKAG
jgi:hemolysin-activating ACP:hemolysin acyltransferase